MPKVSTTAATLKPGVFAELEPSLRALAARGGSLIPLHIGDTCLSPPAAASWSRSSEVLSRAALYGYGSTSGMPEFRSLIARELSLAEFAPDMANVALGVGGTHALWAAARATLDPGDEVLACAPYWPLAPGLFHLVGAVTVDVPVTQELYRDPSFDVGAALRAHITDRTRAIYFVSPNNPDGKVFSRESLMQIANIASEFDLWVFADEVYRDFCFDAHRHTSFASIDPKLERTIVVGSFSKSHALAGARVGYVVAREEVATAATRVTTHAGFNVPVVAQKMCLDALDQGATWKRNARDVYLTARDVALAGIREIATSDGTVLTTHTPEGGTYLFIDFAEVLGTRPLRDLLALGVEHGILLAPGVAFGAKYGSCARLCFTSVGEAELTTGIARLGEAMRAFRLAID